MAEARATVADVADTVHADVYVGVGEQRGGGLAATHSVWVNVEALPRQTTVLPLPSLFGHVIGARIERPDGSVILQMPLHPEPDAVGLIAISVDEGMAQAAFDEIRSELLANRLAVTLVVDETVPTLGRGVVAVEQSHDWEKRACQ